MNRRELITGALATGAGTVLVSNRVSANSPEATDVPRRQQPDQLMGEAAEAGYFSEQQLHEVLGTTQLKRPDSGPTGLEPSILPPVHSSASARITCWKETFI
jgi:hypothetical protein